MDVEGEHHIIPLTLPFWSSPKFTNPRFFRFFQTPNLHSTRKEAAPGVPTMVSTSSPSSPGKGDPETIKLCAFFRELNIKTSLNPPKYIKHTGFMTLMLDVTKKNVE
jgi:hypothetical protein